METTHNTELVEAIAKAIYAQWSAIPGYVRWMDGGNSDKQCSARAIACQAIKSVAPGAMVLAPLEPTEAMLAAVRRKPHPTRPDRWDSSNAAIYRKMVAAVNGITLEGGNRSGG